MVLRKPYAFLIKHFKFIHIVLSMLLMSLLYKNYTVYSFYDDFLKESKFNITGSVSNTLITPIIYVYIALIILIVFSIYLLMNFKKKNTKYYLSLSLLITN